MCFAWDASKCGALPHVRPRFCRIGAQEDTRTLFHRTSATILWEIKDAPTVDQTSIVRLLSYTNSGGSVYHPENQASLGSTGLRQFFSPLRRAHTSVDGYICIHGFLPPIRRSPPFFLKSFTSDASHPNAPYPYRSTGASEIPHTVSDIYRTDLRFVRNVRRGSFDARLTLYGP